MGADRGRRRITARRVRAAADPAHQARGHHAHVERARHRGADQGGHPHRARARHPRARRRQPVGGAHGGRRTRPRLRLLRLHRPQDLRAHRHRRALRQEGAPRRHAALPGRRQHDRVGARRPHRLRQAAAEVRGRNAADRGSDRARRGAQLHDAGRPRQDRPPRGGAYRLRARTTRGAAVAQDLRHGAEAKAALFRFTRTGCTPTTSRPSSTGRASRFARAITARSR